MTSKSDPTSDYVAELAEERGVSVRTVWRWVATTKATGSWPAKSPACGSCGKRLPDEATLRRRYCDTKCRVRAQRARQQR